MLVAIAACGNAEREPPVPTPKPSEPPRCKPGSTRCAGDDVTMCEDDGSRRVIASCRGGCREGACVDTCGANDVELVYIVDGDRTLLSFDPRKLPGDPFHVIGELSCDPSSNPNSMAVDRSGIAWLGYASGVLYQASILDAHCFAKSARPTGALTDRYGMGFVTDGPKATTEKLYVAEYGGTEIATIDTSTFPTRWVKQGRLPIKRDFPPELSGTSEGRLYGYFPGSNDRGFVQEIDRKGNLVGHRWDLPAKRGAIGGWAFAFWGDVFYVFLAMDDINEVHAIHRKTGKYELAVKNHAHRIVGAGVSTCAPLLEKPL